MMETHGMLRSDTTALFERLREANGLLTDVLGGAQSNLTSIEQILSVRVNEFVSTMNNLLERTGTTTTSMDEHIGSFYGVTQQVLGNLGDLAQQFDAHGRTLSEAVVQLENAHQRTGGAVTEHRDSLEGLVTALDTRTNDLDQRLKRFSTLLDESIQAAEGRARDIARTIAEGMTTSTRAIGEQYDQVRAASEDERKRTMEGLHSVYQQAIGDAEVMFQSATERFTEIVQSMKHMAREMERELEGTRQELRRGIMELPQETAETTAQMRRVVVDQIEALAELNRIVARHGREFEVVEATPVRETAREVAREPGREVAREPVRRIAEAPGGAPPRRIELPQRPAPAPRPDVHPSAPPIVPQQPPRRAEGGAAPANNPAPSGNGSTQGQQAGQQGNQANWLSDLLNRASQPEAPQPPRGEGRPNLRQEPQPRPEEQRPPRHTIESLDSLSVDIARMIDHDAAAELWDRYNRGERNVFTRRLYTMQGQKAFDEIRRRYRGDREFKQTVDRYIGEFERLLDEVSRDDRGQVVVRTYLTSETGKVYTMLAHAAGRIE
jgi:ABC-type transporter Mla subunit MlaD